MVVTLGLARTVEVRTRDEQDTPQRPPLEITDNREDAAKDGQASGKGKAGLRHHTLELCREGERTASRPAGGKRGGEPIGTLSCSTLLYTEKSWRAEASVESLPQPRAVPLAPRYSILVFSREKLQLHTHP